MTDLTAEQSTAVGDDSTAVPAIPGLKTLFDHLSDAVYLIDPASSNILWGNCQAWKMLGMSEQELLTHSVLSLQKDVHSLAHWQEIVAIIVGRDKFRFVGSHCHKDGHEVQVEVYTSHFDWQGNGYLLSIARDITTRMEQQEAGNYQKQLWYALNEASDGLWDWEVQTGKVYFSPQLKRMLGYGPDEMKPVVESWKKNVHPEDLDAVFAKLTAHLEGKLTRFEAEYRLRNRNGHYLWVHDRGRVSERDEFGNPTRVVGMVNNVTDRKHLEQELQRQASYDSLTGLLNRREGLQMLDTQLELSRRLALPLGLAFIDIDLFKQVNDVYGHNTGDEVLKQLALCLQDSLRAADIVCRWGGEEFVVFTPDSDLAAISTLANKLRQAVEGLSLAGLPSITISVGVAVSDPSMDAKALISNADMALYRAKENGRNRVECFPLQEPTASGK